MHLATIDRYHVSILLRETFWPTWIPGYPQTHNTFDLIRLVADVSIDSLSAGTAMR
jgi:D-galactarolactone cycloisomerase